MAGVGRVTLVDTEAAAAALGVSAAEVRRLVDRGVLSAHRIRRDRGRPALRFELAELDRFERDRDLATRPERRPVLDA